MSAKTTSQALAIVGAIGFVLSLAGNPLGLGGNLREFGWLQILGTALSALMLVAGVWKWKTPLWALVASGVCLAFVSLLADEVGIGGNPYEFGWVQSLGVIAGLGMIWFGLRPYRREE
jgi:hypothetical protein